MTEDRRKTKRCSEDTGIMYSIFNQTMKHGAVALNYSRSGMYFESDRPLAPGTTIIIRTQSCDHAAGPDSTGYEKGPTPYYCRDTQSVSEACRELKTIGVAEVKRCETRPDSKPDRYGIAVHYIR